MFLKGCELLTIFYLYKVLCSLRNALQAAYPVVNCLQFFIFTRFFAVNNTLMLMQLSCELLTIFYLYKVLCSICKKNETKNVVVNCLQFFIFTRFFAVRRAGFYTTNPLWIAYNFLSLQGSLQSAVTKSISEKVVNCLQFFIFTRFFAVICRNWIARKWLWIAYNFLSLQGSLQCFIVSMFILLRCELLTIFYLYKVLCSL